MHYIRLLRRAPNTARRATTRSIFHRQTAAVYPYLYRDWCHGLYRGVMVRMGKPHSVSVTVETVLRGQLLTQLRETSVSHTAVHDDGKVPCGASPRPPRPLHYTCAHAPGRSHTGLPFLSAILILVDIVHQWPQHTHQHRQAPNLETSHAK